MSCLCPQLKDEVKFKLLTIYRSLFMDLFLLSDVVFVSTVEGNFGFAVFVTNTATTAALVCCTKQRLPELQYVDIMGHRIFLGYDLKKHNFTYSESNLYDTNLLYSGTSKQGTL